MGSGYGFRAHGILQSLGQDLSFVEGITLEGDWSGSRTANGVRYHWYRHYMTSIAFVKTAKTQNISYIQIAVTRRDVSMPV